MSLSGSKLYLNTPNAPEDEVAGQLNVVCEQQSTFRLVAEWLQPSQRHTIFSFDAVTGNDDMVCVISHNHGLSDGDIIHITGDHPYVGQFRVEMSDINLFFISARYLPLPDAWAGAWEKRGDPYDLNGWTASMQIRHSLEHSPLLHAVDSDSGIRIVRNLGRVIVSIPADITAGFRPGAYRYDLILVNPNDGDWTKRLLEGEFRVNPAVTVLQD